MKGSSQSQKQWFTVGLVSAWYVSNIGVLLLNKYLLSNYGFKYPIFLTMCHMIACSLFSYIAIVWFKMVPLQTIRSRLQFLKISALGLIFCGSVVSGNVSLRYLPVSFTQAVGATTPFFTAVFAYLMTWKREAWVTYITLFPVVAGVVIASGYFAAEWTKFPSLWIRNVCWCYSHKSIKISSSRDFVVIRGRKAELHEPSALYGSNSCFHPTSCNNPDGAKCSFDHSSSCKKWHQSHLVFASEFSPCILCQFDQFLGYQAYQCIDSPGTCTLQYSSTKQFPFQVLILLAIFNS